MIWILAFAIFCATIIGGLFALKFKDKLHLILGFSAGAVIGVAFFDLLPETFEIGQAYFDFGQLALFVCLGFLGYLLLDRTIFFHSHADNHDHGNGDHARRGGLGAGSLSLHSFVDGVAIGLVFQVSAAMGAIVAVAILVHRFSDGINTVGMVLKNNGGKKHALNWLFVDAAAPVLGILLTLFFTLPEKSLAIILALFTGSFLYLGASDLVPESHHSHPKLLTTIMTILGALVLYGAISIAGI